jgi:hypothetical protein
MIAQCLGRPGIRSARRDDRRYENGQIAFPTRGVPMEPQRNESARSETTPEQKKPAGRFKIVKLEERIAPKIGGGGHHHTGDICRDSFRCY